MAPYVYGPGQGAAGQVDDRDRARQGDAAGVDAHQIGGRVRAGGGAGLTGKRLFPAPVGDIGYAGSSGDGDGGDTHRDTGLDAAGQVDDGEFVVLDHRGQQLAALGDHGADDVLAQRRAQPVKAGALWRGQVDIVTGGKTHQGPVARLVKGQRPQTRGTAQRTLRQDQVLTPVQLVEMIVGHHPKLVRLAEGDAVDRSLESGLSACRGDRLSG